MMRYLVDFMPMRATNINIMMRHEYLSVPPKRITPAAVLDAAWLRSGATSETVDILMKWGDVVARAGQIISMKERR